MAIKPEFNPEITRIKLNPEQAVLACSCWSGGRYTTNTRTGRERASLCYQNQRRNACGTGRVNRSVS